MALLFSKVLLTQDGTKESTTFLMGGIPESIDDMQNWTAFQAFMQCVSKGKPIKADVTAYLYGEQEPVVATPEEVAYIMMRIERRMDFLEARCLQYCSLSFDL